MARPAKFTTDQILDGARDAALEHWRATTIAQVADQVGAPVGSVYHRFASRDVLFGELWARSIRRFHEGLHEANEIDDPREALAALARHVPRFCRTHPADAKAMTLYRLADLLQKWPADRCDELATINDDIGAGLREITRRRYGRLTDRRFRLALIATRQAPYGLLRPLVGGDIPAEYDDICVASAEGILALGD